MAPGAALATPGRVWRWRERLRGCEMRTASVSVTGAAPASASPRTPTACSGGAVTLLWSLLGVREALGEHQEDHHLLRHRHARKLVQQPLQAEVVNVLQNEGRCVSTLDARRRAPHARRKPAAAPHHFQPAGVPRQEEALQDEEDDRCFARLRRGGPSIWQPRLRRMRHAKAAVFFCAHVIETRVPATANRRKSCSTWVV